MIFFLCALMAKKAVANSSQGQTTVGLCGKGCYHFYILGPKFSIFLNEV